MFHQTTPLTPSELKEGESKAASQDELTLGIFRKDWYEGWSPSQVCDMMKYIDSESLLTSFRRSITNLTKRGYLIKLSETVPGPYGRPEGLWKANPENTLPYTPMTRVVKSE